MSIRIIKDLNQFQLPSKYQEVATPVEFWYEGSYKVICKARLTDSAYRKRRAIAIVKIIFTLGIVLICDKKVKSHLEQKIRFYLTPIEKKVHNVAKKQEVVLPKDPWGAFQTLSSKTDRSDDENKQRLELLSKLMVSQYTDLCKMPQLLTLSDFKALLPEIDNNTSRYLTGLFIAYANEEQRHEFLIFATEEIFNCPDQRDAKIRLLMELIDDKSIPLFVDTIKKGNWHSDFARLFWNSSAFNNSRYKLSMTIALYNSKPDIYFWENANESSVYTSYIVTAAILHTLENTAKEQLEEGLGAIDFTNTHNQEFIIKNVFAQLTEIEEEKLQILAQFYLEQNLITPLIAVLRENSQSFSTIPCIKKVLLHILYTPNACNSHGSKLLHGRGGEGWSAALTQAIQTLSKERQEVYFKFLNENYPNLVLFECACVNIQKLQKTISRFNDLSLVSFRFEDENSKRLKLLENLVYNSDLPLAFEDKNERDAFLNLLNVSDYQSFLDLSNNYGRKETFQLLTRFFFKYASNEKLKEFVDSACREEKQSYPQIERFIESLQEEAMPRLAEIVKDSIPGFVQTLAINKLKNPQVESLIWALYQQNPSKETLEAIKAGGYEVCFLVAKILKILEEIPSHHILESRLKVIKIPADIVQNTFDTLFSRIKDKNIEESKLLTLIDLFLNKGKGIISSSQILKKNLHSLAKPGLRGMILCDGPHLKKDLTELFDFNMESEKEEAIALIKNIQAIEGNYLKLYMAALRDVVQGEKLEPWRKILKECGLNLEDISIATYEDFKEARERIIANSAPKDGLPLTQEQ